MIRLSDQRRILCDETGKILKENIEQLMLTEEGVKNLEIHKYSYCACRSLIRTLPEAVGRCHICGRFVCPKCYAGVCSGVVCQSCCPVKSKGVTGSEAGFYCFSCRAKQSISRAVSFFLQRITSRRRLPVTRR